MIDLLPISSRWLVLLSFLEINLEWSLMVKMASIKKMASQGTFKDFGCHLKRDRKSRVQNI